MLVLLKFGVETPGCRLLAQPSGVDFGYFDDDSCFKMVAPQFTISVMFGIEKPYQCLVGLKTPYYNVTVGIRTSGLPNSLNHRYGSPTLLPNSP